MKKSFIILALLIFLTGCSEKVKYVYVSPSCPEIPEIQKVDEINATIKSGCLWLENENTNLCGENLIKILSLIRQLRVQEEMCMELISSYNSFIENKK